MSAVPHVDSASPVEPDSLDTAESEAGHPAHAGAGAGAGAELIVAPSRDDDLVRGLSDGIGGPVGRHAAVGARRSWWTPLRVIVALAVLFSVLGWVQKLPCRDPGNWNHQRQYTTLCYSEQVALYGTEGLADGKRPYLDYPVEYPVLIGGFMEVASLVAKLSNPAHEEEVAASDAGRTATFLDVSTLLMAVAAVATALCTARAAGLRPWDGAIVAAAPVVVLFLGTNWDMAAVAFGSAGILAWARRRHALAGVLLGLGVATKLFPVLFLLPLLLLCLRAARLRAWVVTAAATVLTVALIYIPAYVAASAFREQGEDQVKIPGSSAWHALTTKGLGAFFSALAPHHDGGLNAVARFFSLNYERTADWGSLPFALQHYLGTQFGTPALNRATELALIVLLLALAVLVLLAPRRPRVGQVLFLTVVAFLLTNKVYSPQYALWLLPLIALARPRWREVLIWQASEIVVLIAKYLHLAYLSTNSASGIPEGWVAGTVLVRDAVLVWLCGLIVRDVLRPQHDPVRAGTAVDDPAGGVLEHAPDA
ncbi:MAG: glycosyltransferase family 87 protein, partial [Frankiaceae bacterium]